jgi:hypothetical protein
MPFINPEKYCAGMDNGAQFAGLKRVLRLFGRGGIEAWLFGGWAVDFHLGAVTRTHADVDLAVWESDLPRIRTALAGDGWSHAPEEGEDGYTGYERGGVRLELAFLVRLEDGRVCTPTRSGYASWPADAFGDEVGEVGGVRARVIGLRALREDKASPKNDPRTTAKDRADLDVLEQGGGG